LLVDYPAPPESHQRFGLSHVEGEPDFIVRLDAKARIILRGPSQDPDYWRRFQFDVPRFPNLEDHIDKVRGVLTEALQIIQNWLVSGAVNFNDRAGGDPLSQGESDYVVKHFTDQVKKQYGLVVELAGLDLFLVHRRASQTLIIRQKSLLNEIKKKLALRENAGSPEEREHLTAQITAAEGELDILEQRLREQTSQVETVRIFQLEDRVDIVPPKRTRTLPPGKANSADPDDGQT
jgi:hypothetical protein